jgi:hypothetical protein
MMPPPPKRGPLLSRPTFRSKTSRLIGRTSPLWFALSLWAGVLTPWATPAQGAEDDLVPAGTVQARATLSHETQTKAIARDSVSHGLEVYALPDPSNQSAVSGTLSRNIDEADLLMQVGITDHWNVSLLVPYVQAVQQSTLRVRDPGADPVLTATVAALQDKTLSGMGNLRFTSLHRPVFSDFNGFVWGYGYQGATSPNSGVYTGSGSLQTRDPYGGFFAFVHYTRFPSLSRSRIDLRGEYQYPFVDRVDLPTGSRVSVQGGATSIFSASWEHEPGAWGYGLGVQGRNSLPTILDGERQEDSVKEYVFHAQLGFGNLIDLERSPIRFPYQALLSFDTTVSGFNTLLRDRWSIAFLTYF